MNKDKLDKHGYPLLLAHVWNERVMDISVGRGPMKLQLIMPKLYISNPNVGKNISSNDDSYKAKVSPCYMMIPVT